MPSLSLAVLLISVAAAQNQTPPPAPPAPPAQGTKGSDQAAPPPAEPPPPPTSTPAPAPGAKAGDEISLDEWDRADWQLVQPKTSLLELGGYFRVRSDILRRINFGNGTVTEYAGLQPAGRYIVDGSNADFTTTNMRLRVEPTINVSENIHLVTTLDFLDNVQLGGQAKNPFTTEQSKAQGAQVSILSNGQNTTRSGINSVTDALVVKRVYARMTALNDQLELRIGRMPSEWGLGMFSNAGNCLDCDFGDVVDRAQVSFKLADLIFTPMYDWVSSGPVTNPWGRSGGQPLDAVNWDDVEQYSVRMMKLDSPATIREKVAAGQTVLNFGVWGIWRRQFRDLSNTFLKASNTTTGGTATTITGTSSPSSDPTAVAEIEPSGSTPAAPESDRRDSNIFTVDGYLKLWSGTLEIGVELAGIYGTFQYNDPTDTTNKTIRNVTLAQLGGALEATLHFKGEYEGLTLSLKTGAASGDTAKGFGALDYTTSQFGNNRISRTSPFDSKMTNFQFSPDYHLDLLLFRQLIGTVTDAWYVKPEVSYLFANNIGGKLGVLYAQAIYGESTFSGITSGSGGGSRPLGIEVDGELSYGLLGKAAETGALKASFAGGILFPLAGFKRGDAASAAGGTAGDAGSFAWTLQTRLYVTF